MGGGQESEGQTALSAANSLITKRFVALHTSTPQNCDLWPVLCRWWWWWWRRKRWEVIWTCWARTSATLLPAGPLPPLCVEEEDEDAVEEVVVVVVEEVPWMALLIQCPMLMLPSWLDMVQPSPPPSSSSPCPPSSSSPSPCPSPSEHEEVSG